MALAEVKNWFAGAPAPNAAIAQVAIASALSTQLPAALSEHPPAATSTWSAARIALAESLWGEGFLFPGGASEILRFARPLGLSGSASLLLVGAGAGGPLCAIARQLGVLVSGFEADPFLAALAADRARQTSLGKRIQMEGWDPAQPAFRAGAFHHALALEPLHGLPTGKPYGGRAEPVMAAIAVALRPGGQLVLLEMVADAPQPTEDTEIAAWARLENRRADLPSEAAITRMLGRLGFDVRATEDLSQRHLHLATLGWRDVVRRMRQIRPDPLHAALLVREAELWSRRLELIGAGRLRLLRWHAIRKGGQSARPATGTEPVGAAPASAGA